MLRSGALVSVLCVLCGCVEDRFPPHDERLDDVTVPFSPITEVTVVRAPFLPDEETPVASEVEVVVLTATQVRVPATKGAVEVGLTSRVTVTFEAPGPGVVEVFVNWGKKVGNSSQRVYLVEPLDAQNDEQITYAYRIENCQRLARAVTHTLCEENGEVFVYDASGQHEVTLAGRELRVVGPEVWVSQANGLSHWTDLGTELRFDGTAMLDLAPLPRGETRAGRALRATSSGGLVEVTWNGLTLESRPVEVLGLMNQDEAVFLAGDALLRVGPGQLCSAPQVGMDERCEALFALAIDAERVWVESIVESGDALALVRNRSAPFASAGFVRMPRIRNSQAPWATLTDFVTSSLPAWNLGYGVTEFPTFTENGGWVREWRHDGLLVAASDDWLISRMGPYTLRFHRMR